MRPDCRTGPVISRRALLGGTAAGFACALMPSSLRAAENFDSLVAEQMATGNIPGLAVGIARQGSVTFLRAYGFADLERRRRATTKTMFHVASITKTTTALATMLLVDDGRIALDEPIAPHLDFAILGKDAGAITFQHLLAHTSGISDEIYYQTDFRQRGSDATLPLSDFVRDYLGPGGRYVGTGNVKRTPGAAWDYSNVGYALLGYLVGKICGQDMRVFTRDRLFRPLRIGHTAWTIADTPERLRATPYDLVDGVLTPVEPVGFPDWPAGMIRSSISDLTLLVAAAANRGMVRNTRLLSAAGMARMLEMQRPAGLPAWLTGQGLGWQQSLLDGVPRINHWGGDPGVFTMAYLDPARRTGIALLSNISVTPASRDALKIIAARALA